MARGTSPGKKEKQPIAWWVLLLVGTPLVLMMSIFTGRKLANALVGSKSSAKVRPSTNLDPSTMDELQSEELQPTDNFYTDANTEGDDPRERAQRAIDSVRARRGRPSVESDDTSRRERPPQEDTDKSPDTEPPKDAETDFEGLNTDLDMDTIRETDRALESDDLVDDGDFPSSMPPSGYREKPTNTPPGSTPSPTPKISPNDDFDDLVEENDSPSFMGSPPKSGDSSPPPPSTTSPPPASLPGPTSGKLAPQNFSIQVANFKNKNSADALKQELSGRGYAADVKVVNQGGEEFFKVKVGKFENKQKAEETAKNLQLQNYTGFVQED